MLKALLLLFLTLKATSGGLSDYANHPCYRDCSKQTEPMQCEFEWTIELYSTLPKLACGNCQTNYTDCLRRGCLVANGVNRDVEVVNRMLPGPSIQVCEGDTVLVNVKNRLKSERVTSIHWHGIRQKGSPHMDGVSLVTQCPIIPRSSLQYKFKAADPGTHFWHAHSGSQQADGVFGALVVRQSASKNAQASQYDIDSKDHVIILNDWCSKKSWSNQMGAYFFSGEHDASANSIDSILINGKGMHPTKNPLLPLAEFTVRKESKYRFRVINAGSSNCPLQFSVDGHNLTLIAIDGQPIDPFEVESFISNSGERFDFVLNANKEAKDYWIKVRGEDECASRKIFQKAVLKYENSKTKQSLNSRTKLEFEDTSRSGMQLRPFFSDSVNQTSVPIDELMHIDLKLSNENIIVIPNKKTFLRLNTAIVQNTVIESSSQPHSLYPLPKSATQSFTPQVNGISFEAPSSPLLYSSNSFSQKNICNEESKENVCSDSSKLCSCLHLIEVNLNDLVELILVNEADLTESVSFHLHGHHFEILGVEKIGSELRLERVIDMDKNGTLKRNFFRAPIKDTLVIPAGGYAVIRFVADNPGVWLANAQFGTGISGMKLLFKVGDESDLPKEPKNWPKCDPYHESNNVGKIRGKISCKQTQAIQPNSVVEINLVDASIMDIPAVTLASITIENPKSFPISYEIEFERDKITSFARLYGINARITRYNKLEFLNDEFVSIVKNQKIQDVIDFNVIALTDPSAAAQSQNLSKISGTIDMKQRRRLRPNSTVKISLIDSSLADVAAVTLSEISIINPKEFPIQYSIEVDSNKLKPYGTYAINVRIERGGKLEFINDEFIPILDDGVLLETVGVMVISVDGNSRTISGSVECQKQPSGTLTEGSVLKIQITDTSRMDAPAVVISEAVINNPGKFPIKYEIELDEKKLTEIGEYSISARISNADRLDYWTDTRTAIIKDQQLLDEIDINVVPVNRAPSAVTKKITGSISCTDKQKCKIKPGSTMKISVQDISRADGPANVISEKSVEVSAAFPIKYTINFDAQKVKPETGATYSISARISKGKKLEFINDEQILIAKDDQLLNKIDFKVVPV